MSEIAQVKAALIRFQGGIKSSDGEAISGALAELDELLAAHRQQLDPRLVHFLEGRSYAKAALWLGVGGEGGGGQPGTPPGGCSARS